MKVLGPIDSSMPLTSLLMPLIIDAITMTTMTPMATPRMVSAARTLFDRSESSAIPTPSVSEVIAFIRLSAYLPIRLSSLLPQRRNRVEPRRATGRVHSRNDADATAQNHADHDGPRGDR